MKTTAFRNVFLAGIVLSLLCGYQAQSRDGCGWDTGGTASQTFSGTTLLTGTLGVTGATTLTGGATVGETLGAELVTIDAACTGWTLTSGWSCVGDGTIAHVNPGGTTTATYTLPGVASGDLIKTVWAQTVSTPTGGVTPSISGASGATRTTAATFTEYIVAGTDGVLTFTPANTAFRNVITSISAKKRSNQLTSGGGPLRIQQSLTDSTANQAVLNITATGTKAAGTSTILQIDDDGTNSGTENAIQVRSGGVAGATLSTAGTWTGLGVVSATSFTSSQSTSGSSKFTSTSAWTNDTTGAGIFSYSGIPAIQSSGSGVYIFHANPTLTNNHQAGSTISGFRAATLSSADADIQKNVLSSGTGWDFIINSASFRVNGAGKISTGTTAAPPVPSSCGNTPSVQTGSTNSAGNFTIGATGTGCILTWATAFTYAPACAVSGPAAITATSAAATLTVVAAPGTYSYICVGLNE